MELLVICLIVSLLLVIVLAGLFVRSLLSRQSEATRESHSFLLSMVKMQGHSNEEHTKVMQQQAGLIDKAMALVATSDPLAFQQIQVMGTPTGYDDTVYDPSDEGEMERIAARNRDLAEQGDEVNGAEESFLADIAGAGIDPAQFYGVGFPNNAP